MIGTMSRFLQRFYSSFAAAKSPLATLRKKTGFPIAKCREALSLHADKLEDAEKWLQEQAHKEGWAKAEQLRGRATKQGHIGVLLEQRKAAIVEVNCETDFVAKNDLFKELVSTITRSLFQYEDRSNPKAVTHIFPLSDRAVAGLKTMSGERMSDLVTKAVGQLSENIHITRGYMVTCNDGMLSSFVYNSTRSSDDSNVEMGRYAAVAHLTSSSGDSVAIQKLGRQICQQIVGNNPALSADEHGNSLLEALKSQPWLLDPSVTVNEVLAKHTASVTDFVRCECGETEN